MSIITFIADELDGNDTLYEIIFDEEFLGGMSLRCEGNRGYRLPASCLLNLSYGKRWDLSSTHPYGKQQRTKQQTQHKSYSQATTTQPEGSGKTSKCGFWNADYVARRKQEPLDWRSDGGTKYKSGSEGVNTRSEGEEAV